VNYDSIPARFEPSAPLDEIYTIKITPNMVTIDSKPPTYNEIMETSTIQKSHLLHIWNLFKFPNLIPLYRAMLVSGEVIKLDVTQENTIDFKKKKSCYIFCSYLRNK